MRERGATVLVVDGGGRGTALVKEYSESPHVDKIIAVPGNDWMKKVSEKPVTIFPEVQVDEPIKIAELAAENKVDLADVSSERALRAGVVNFLRSLFKIPAVGPTGEASRIEWDKNDARIWGKYFKLPQPYFNSFEKEADAEKFLETQKEGRWFVKAAGLAEGKGAIPATSKQEVLNAIRWLKKEFPKSSKVVLIEEWLSGEEFSAFAVSDSRNFAILGYAKDYKREYDGDKGENTGGMGAISRPQVSRDLNFQSKVEGIFGTVFNNKPTGPYRGILYLGGMAVKKENDQADPYVIEFNARWGDPEAQVLVPGLNVDFFEMGMESARGTLRRVNISNDRRVRVAVVGAAKGYPRKDELASVQGKEIFGLEEAQETEGVTIFGAGVKVEGEKHYTDGGRLFHVVGEGRDVVQARDRAYEAMDKIRIEGDNLHFRTDIGS